MCGSFIFRVIHLCKPSDATFFPHLFNVITKHCASVRLSRSLCVFDVIRCKCTEESTKKLSRFQVSAEHPTTRYDVLNLIQSCSSGNDDDVIELSLLERIVRTGAINSRVRLNVIRTIASPYNIRRNKVRSLKPTNLREHWTCRKFRYSRA